MITKESPVKFRHELKHYININDYYQIRQRLLAVTDLDCHAGEKGYYNIRSLYFDTPDDKALREKLNGINPREKFRLRYYNDAFDCVKLEKKSKVNNLGNKLSAPLTREECEKMIEGQTEWMRSSKHPLVLELYAKMQYQLLRPKTVVDYIREPYLYEPGNVRVTIDSDIRTGLHSKDFFNRELPTIRSGVGDMIVLEVKYDEFLPDIIRNAIQLNNRRAAACSKYALSRLFG
ncbi:polyphosphate polymerase domain-containing protein [Anoxybacterium hadale]|uniref:polyphosphate polymerase domain-containing protein n=1 Tax=Anoxybacterium hadale TaxID=3408580 RepID=UPI003B002DB7